MVDICPKSTQLLGTEVARSLAESVYSPSIAALGAKLDNRQDLAVLVV
jgi:hypothetical protein